MRRAWLPAIFRNEPVPQRSPPRWIGKEVQAVLHGEGGGGGTPVPQPQLLRPAVEADLMDPSLAAERELDGLRGWLVRVDEISRDGESRPERVLELLMEDVRSSR